MESRKTLHSEDRNWKDIVWYAFITAFVTTAFLSELAIAFLVIYLVSF